MTRTAAAATFVNTLPEAFGEPPSRGRAIDLVFLSRKTGGDRKVERDVLALLRSQIALILQRAPHGTRDEVRQMANAIRGAGRHVGAFAVADSAAALSLATTESFPMAYDAFIDELERAASFLRSLD